MISPSWKSLRRARTKKKSLLSIETNKVSNFLRAARRVERTGTSPFDQSFFLSFFRQRNKIFKSSGRRLSQLPSCIALGCRCGNLWRRATWRETPRLLGPLWLYILERLAAVRFRLVRSFAGKGNKSKSTMMMTCSWWHIPFCHWELIDWHRHWHWRKMNAFCARSRCYDDQFTRTGRSRSTIRLLVGCEDVNVGV